MLYASRLYRELPSRQRYRAEKNPDDLPDLVAEILTGAVERRIRRNLTLEFQRSRADLTRVRGRIDTLRTERRRLLQKGRVACSFDELTTDTPRNRLVKAALNKLRGSVNEKELGRRCRSLAAALDRAGVGQHRHPSTAHRPGQQSFRINLTMTHSVNSEADRTLRAVSLRWLRGWGSNPRQFG